MSGNMMDGLSDTEAREIRDEIKNLVLDIRAGKCGNSEAECRKASNAVWEKLEKKYGVTGGQFDYLYSEFSRSIPDVRK
jgi:hypothetical protein